MNEYDYINAFMPNIERKKLLKHMYRKTMKMTVKKLTKLDFSEKIFGILESKLENSEYENTYLLNLFNIRPSHFKMISLNPDSVNYEYIQNKNKKFCNFFYQDYMRVKDNILKNKDEECEKVNLKTSKVTNMVFVFVLGAFLNSKGCLKIGTL